jgi:uncharacterized protein DUF6535
MSNCQDTSAFYLCNIYQVLTNPNVTRESIPSHVAEPPPFSPPRYAVWVISLWFLSLVMSLCCASLATSLHQLARRYTRLTQPAPMLLTNIMVSPSECCEEEDVLKGE